MIISEGIKFEAPLISSGTIEIKQRHDRSSAAKASTAASSTSTPPPPLKNFCCCLLPFKRNRSWDCSPNFRRWLAVLEEMGPDGGSCDWTVAAYALQP